jgi:hypothetical protein
LNFKLLSYLQSRKRNDSTETVSTASKKSKATVVLDVEVKHQCFLFLSFGFLNNISRQILHFSLFIIFIISG